MYPNKLKILLVDDSEEFVAAASSHLASLPWVEVVGCAHDGAAGVARTSELQPDLVLMDISMPGMNGIEATRRIGQMVPAPPVVMVSMSDEEEYQRSAMEAGAAGYIPKAQFPVKLSNVVCEIFMLQRQTDVPPVDHPIEPMLGMAALAQIDDMVMITDPDGKIVYVNSAFENISGYSSAEVMNHTTSFLESGQQNPDFHRDVWETLSAGKTINAVYLNRRKDGSIYHEQKSIQPIKDASGQIRNFLSTGRCVTKIMDWEQKLLDSEERFRLVTDNINEVFWLSSPDKSKIYYISPAYERIWGRNCTSLYAEPRSWLDAIHADDRDQVDRAVAQDQSGGQYSVEYRIQRPDGSQRWILERAFPIHDDTGGVCRIAGIAQDITERKHIEGDLQRLAYWDALTGLPNRLLLVDRVSQAMVDARRHERLVGVALLDLDQFKKINDSLGHVTGDALLMQVGQRLQRAVRSGDTVSRIGGDEFTFILTDMAHVDDAATVLQKIIHSFNEPYLIDGREVFITASIGITMFPFDDQDVTALLRNAEIAMYRAKESGRNTWQFYTAEMTAKAKENLTIETELRRAIDNNEFELHYQPQVNLFSGKVTGMEALLRWNHPLLGRVEPGKFIPIAEESGLIVRIGEWVLRTACEQAMSWRRAGYTLQRMAVNLSSRQCRERELFECVRRILRETGLPPEVLELEVTESMLLEKAGVTSVSLEQLDALGIRLSIDDFGTGYSCLSYLKRLPIDALKIDRSFVRDIARDPNDAAIVRTIINMAHSLGIQVVAEGVETSAQVQFLSMNGCDAMQGYYFNPPQAVDSITQLLMSKRVLPPISWPIGTSTKGAPVDFGNSSK